MKIVIIDGQGGKLGAQIINLIKNKNYMNVKIFAVGTNAMATEAMMKQKPDVIATGENPIIVLSKDADIIIGPIGIVIANSMYGEITKDSSFAVSDSKAIKLLIPINKCNNIIVGVTNNLLNDSLNQITDYLDSLLK